MSFSITSTGTAGTTSPISAQPVRAPSAERQDFKSLAKALHAGDLSAAKAAYAKIVKDAPKGGSLPSGSAFADVGKALASGDVSAAKSAFGEMVKNATGNGGSLQPPVISLPPVIAPVASTTGGTAGGTLSEVA